MLTCDYCEKEIVDGTTVVTPTKEEAEQRKLVSTNDMPGIQLHLKCGVRLGIITRKEANRIRKDTGEG